MLKSRFISLFVLAILAFLSLGTPIHAQRSVLTPELLSKILILIAAKGIERDVPALISSALGITTSGQAWASRQVSSPDTIGNHHGFAISRGGDQDVTVSLVTPDILHAFRARRDGTAVAALNLNLHTGKLIMVNHDDAQKELDAEWAYWTRAFADAK
jgi:hypothetical protein